MRRTLSSLALIVLTLFAAAPARADEGLAFEPKLLHWQAKTKAQVIGYRLGSERIFDGFVVQNGKAGADLVQVQIGCTVELQMPDGTLRSVTDLVIDQQQWLQGFEAIAQICLTHNYGFSGLFINTGGGFADASNIDLIAPLVQEQIR